jgi:hypothetical protein
MAEDSLTEEPLPEANLEKDARGLLGGPAYRGRDPEKDPAASGIVLVGREGDAISPGLRRQIEIAISNLKRVLDLGETPAKILGPATRIAAKTTAYPSTPSWSTGCCAS